MATEIKRLKKDKEKANERGDWKDYANICNYLGVVLSRQGRYEDALENHREELQACSILSDDLGIAIAHRRIGECYSEIGYYTDALTHQKRYLEFAKMCESKIEEQRAWATLGRTYFLMQNSENINEIENDLPSVENAQQAFMKALELCEELKSQLKEIEYAEMRGRVLLNLGLVFDQQNNVTRCAECLRQAIFLMRKYDLKEDLHRCQISLASLYYRHGQPSLALRLIDRALDCAKALHDCATTVDTLMTKAQILINIDDFEGAKTYLKKAFKMNSPVSEDNTGAEKNLKVVIVICECEKKLLKLPPHDKDLKVHLYEKIADGCFVLGDLKQSLKYYHKMLDCAIDAGKPSSELAPIYVSLAQTYADDKKYDKAIEFYYKELECRRNNEEEQCKTLLNIAEVMEQNIDKQNEREHILQKALLLAEEVSNYKLQVQCLHLLKEFYESKGDDLKLKEITHKLQNFLKSSNIHLEEMSESEESQNIFDDVDLKDLSDYTDSEEEVETADVPQRFRRRKVEAKVNEVGETPLHRACIRGNLNIVKSLIERGHPVNPRDYCGWLPIHEASNHNHYDIVEYLIEKGASVNDGGGEKCEGITPLHDAASCGNIEIMELLISKGASVTVLTDNHETVLDCFINWYKRVEKDLDKETLQKCLEMEDNLKILMKQSKKEYKSADNLQNLSVDKSLCQNDIYDCNKNSTEYHHKSPTNFAEISKNVPHSLSSTQSKTLGKTKCKQTSALLDADNTIKDWLIDDILVKKQIKRRWSTSSNDDGISLEAMFDQDKKRKRCVKRRLKQQKMSKYTHNDNTEDRERDVAVCGYEGSADEDSNMSDQDNKSGYTDNVIPTGISRDVREDNHVICVKVQVGHKLLFVPIPDPSQTVGSLANDVANRYFNLTGVKPQLTLVTADGATLCDLDCVGDVLKNCMELVATLNSWDLPPLPERYEQFCKNHGISLHPSVSALLQDCNYSGVLTMNHLAIPSGQMKPLFSSLSCQASLKTLNLCGSYIGDDNAKLLSACLCSLPNLMVLVLRCCGLTSRGLMELSNGIYSPSPLGQVKPFQYLKELDFSYNWFGPESSGYLAVLLNNVSSLSLLDISGVHATKWFSNSSLCIALEQCVKLQDLRLAANILTVDDLKSLFDCFKVIKIRSLDLSNCVRSSLKGFGKLLASFLSYSCCSLETLCLCGCFLQNKDILEIAQSISHCKSLHELDLSANPSVTIDSVVNLCQTSFKNGLPLSVLSLYGTIKVEENTISELCVMLSLGTLKKVTLTVSDIDTCKTKMIQDAWLSTWGKDCVCHFGPNCSLELLAAECVK
ncbi:tonsoku-like protein [Tachypleus tridentatus]|uniref:tonsoku-like protein n=1 Tax=Tachypleus tridentatus TaxID=6853 RepID=UPI003FD5FCFE